MYLSSITGNVLNKFNNQKINILYEPQYNLFDVLISQCDLRIFCSKNSRFKNLENSNTTMFDNNQFDLFNYNVGITNNILAYSTNRKFSQLHLNSIIFTHSFKPNSLKKEDLLLLNNNLNKDKKVFFTKEALESWRLDNNAVYSYGIPLDKFFDEKNVRQNKVLLIDIENSPHTATLCQYLKNHNIEIDILTTLDFNVNSLRAMFNQYSVCIDLNEYNIINLLVAICCGCNAITYSTNMIMNNFSDTPNLFTARTVQDLIQTINSALNSPVMDHTKYFEENYSFEEFKNNTTNLILEANNRAYTI